jgi:hypothetical protein
MPTLEAHGIAVPLPAGFEGRIFVRNQVGDEVPYPVTQLATFALPPEVGDFGGGAVNLMGSLDIFATLFEYGPESLGKRLFARQGMPRSLSVTDFRPYVLRRGLTGQSGTQWFFTESGRPFTLYIVLGSHAQRNVLVPRVNSLIGSLDISPVSGLTAARSPIAAPTAPAQPAYPPTPAGGARWN